MNTISSSCTAPTQPENLTSDMAHPRFIDYLNHQSAMSRQLVESVPFSLWLESTERYEQGFTRVFLVTAPDAPLSLGWYKNIFGKNNSLTARHGPFNTEAEAIAS